MPRLRSLILLTLLTLSLPTLGLACKSQVQAPPVKLTYWRVFDGPDTMADIISDYRRVHSNVTIEYRKMQYEDYEQQIINALAEDRGPDIFSIHNTWIGKYQPKIVPLPKTVTLPFQIVQQNLIGQDVITELRTIPTITPATIRKDFVDVVGRDVIRTVPTPDRRTTEQVLGLPLAVDTLVLYYNKDILNATGIATPPATWTDFLKDVTRITRLDDKGNIIVAGAALGMANNIPRFSDILTALMAQNGAVMTNATGYATFTLPPPQSPNKNFHPGVEAARFYTDFASPTKEAYTWNASMPDALEAFTQGRVAFFFGYAYHLPTIRSRAPQLNWGVTSLPQADPERNTVNVANYWVETVSKKTAHPSEAWDFIQFAAKAAEAQKYLAKAQKPTALRSLIQQQLQDPLLEPFANQLLTAQSWYRGRDAGLAEEALAQMVTSILNSTDPEVAANFAVQLINQTIR